MDDLAIAYYAGVFTAIIVDSLFAIGEYFREKAYYYKKKRKEITHEQAKEE